jgi:4-nitrophenyl phosphatase
MSKVVGDVLKSHKAFLIDNYGVLRRANGPIPGVEKSFAKIRRHGNRPLLLSNTANFRPEDLQDKLKDQGIELPLQDIVTSGMALSPYFNQRGLVGKKTLVVGNNITVEYVEKAGGIPLPNKNIMEHFREAKAVVIGWYPIVPPDSANRFGLMSLEIMQAAINALKLNHLVNGVVANPDMIAPVDRETILFACGAIGKLIAECSGRILDQLGKPFQPIYELAFARLPGIEKSEMVMVGDSLDYDILGAKNAGIKSLLVLSGNTSLSDLARSELKPDFLAETFVPEAALLNIP